MPRLAKLDEILFPVEEHPVFVAFSRDGQERQLAVPERKAIVNGRSQRVLGVVSRGYRLVTNAEALELAYQCCATVFPETKPGEWLASAVDAPSTAGYCHIDLLHNSTALDFRDVPPNQRPDVFGPFIRVTNSYKRIGFSNAIGRPKKGPEKAPGRARGGPKYASLGGFSAQSGRLEARGWRVGRSLNVHGAQDWPGLRVDPDVGHGLPTQRAAPPRLQGSRSPWR
jgi:hypothetical protein